MDELKSIQATVTFSMSTEGQTYDLLELENDRNIAIPFIVRSNAENEVFLFALHCMCFRG